MPRMKQQHLGLGEILGIGRSKKRGEEVEDRDDGAPKVTAEKMGRFVAAMADLVKVTLRTCITYSVHGIYGTVDCRQV